MGRIGIKPFDIQELYLRCINKYKLTVVEAIEQLVTAGVSAEDYAKWLDKYYKENRQEQK